jgi:glutaredoxin
MYKSQTVSVMPIGKELILQLLQEAPGKFSDWSQKLQRGLPIDYSTVAQLHEVQLRIPTTLGIPLSVNLHAPVAISIRGKVQATVESPRSKTVKVQVELKPSAVVMFKAEVEAWSPIVVSGVKIQGKAKMFVPVDAKMEIEWGANPQIKASIKPPTQKRDLLVLESRPITFTRSWQQYLRTADEDSSSQEVTVVGDEVNRVSTFNQCAGRKTVGFDVCVRGQVQNIPDQSPTGTPFAIFAGQNKIVVTSQPAESQQDIMVKITSKMQKINGQETHKPQFNILSRNSFFEEESSSSESSSEQEQGSQERDSRQSSAERQQAHRRSQQHRERHPSTPRTPQRNTFQQYRDYQIKKGYKTQVDVELQAHNSRSVIELSHVYDAQERYGQVNMKVNRHQPEQWQACLDAEMMFPENPQSIDQVRDKKILGHAQLRWGQTCNSQNYVQITTQAERSNQQVQYEREMSQYKQYARQQCQSNKAWCSPLAQEDFVEKIGHMLKYRVDIDYQNVPSGVQNATNKVYRALKYYYYSQSDVDQINVQNGQGKIRAELILDAQTKQRVNVTIQTPKENLMIQDLPLSKPLWTLNQKQSFADQMRSYVNEEDEDDDQAECSVTGKTGVQRRAQVETFDGTKFSAPFTSCWVVLAKDCGSAKPEFVVLARKSEQSGEADLKEVKIITRQHRIELKPDNAEYDSVKVKVNGQAYDPENGQDIEEQGQVVAKIDKEGQAVSVDLPETGVEVEFDGYAINVKLSQTYHGQQCGLCGHYDREEADEFRNPDFTEEKDLRQFYMNYLIKDDRCQAPKQLSEVCESEECDKESSSSSSSSSADENDNDNDETTEKPDSKTKVIELDDQICFSTVPVPQCDDNSYASEIKEQKQVPYACVDQDSESAEEYERRARYGKRSLPQLASRQPNFTRTESIPAKCQKYSN